MKSLNSIVFTFLFSSNIYGQSINQMLNNTIKIKGAVKSIEFLQKTEEGKIVSTATIWFDRNGRKVKTTDSDTNVRDFFYLNDAGGLPDMYSDNGSYSINKNNFLDGKYFSRAWIKDGEVQSLFEQVRQENEQEERYFVENGEIYSIDKSKEISLSDYHFSKAIIPFQLNESSSFCKEVVVEDYVNQDTTTTLSFRIISRKDTMNWVDFNFDKKSGIGEWALFEKGMMTEKRDLYKRGEKLSERGLVYTYDSRGNVLRETYGIVDKMNAGNYDRRKDFLYDEYGECIKETDLSSSRVSTIVDFEFNYDANGNWIKQRQFKDKKFAGLVERRITYYKQNEISLQSNLTPALYQSLLTQVHAYMIKADSSYKSFVKTMNEMSLYKDTTNYRALRVPDYTKFIPLYNIIDTICEGSLTKEKSKDIIMIFEPQKLLKDRRNSERIIRIISCGADGNYSLVAEGKNAIVPEAMRSSHITFSGIEIRKDTLVIEHEFLRGWSEHCWLFKNDKFYLVSAIRSGLGNTEYSTMLKYNLVTGKYQWIDTYYDRLKTKKGIEKVLQLPEIETFEVFSGVGGFDF